MSIIYILQGVSAAPETDFLGMFKSVQTVSRFYSFDERLTVLGGINQVNAGLIERVDDRLPGLRHGFQKRVLLRTSHAAVLDREGHQAVLVHYVDVGDIGVAWSFAT